MSNSKNQSKKRGNSKAKLILILILFVISLVFGGTKINWADLSNQDFETILSEASKIILENSDISVTGSSKVDNEYDASEQNSSSTQNPQIPIDLTNSNFEVFVFDVGQADAILVTSNGENLLIDAGNNPDGKLLVKQLKAMGITKINYLVGTHTHEDHIGGIDNVINNFIIDNYYMPSNEHDSATYRDVMSALKSKNLKKVAPKVGHTFNLGAATCEIMAIDSENEDVNSTSIVIEVTYGENKFLFMGDAEFETEETRLWNDVDVLKVGHHGSSTSTSEDFLAQTKPEVGVISLGEGNSYGHPHKEAIEVLNEYEVEIYRTDKQGTIHISSDGKEYKIECLDIHLDGNT